MIARQIKMVAGLVIFSFTVASYGCSWHGSLLLEAME
jgi:hypothetical protein